MKPITYLCFTLLSIVIQFCLMDYINEQIEDTLIGSNSTIDKNLSKIFKAIEQKPHALYYRIGKNKVDENNKYNNYTITAALSTSTELVSTVFDLVYDENVSVPDVDPTMETVFTSSEFDNVTDITFFDKKPSTTKPSETPKKISTNRCYCDLLYKTCDINCCCDNDCSDWEKSVLNCEGRGKDKCGIRSHEDYLYMCTSHFACDKELQSDVFGYLFCIQKVNLPQKQNNKNTLFTLDVDTGLKWHGKDRKRKNNNFTKDPYSFGRPINIVTKNDTVNFLELPITTTNKYCNGFRAVKFLINENVRCYVKLKDLHMLDVIKVSEETNIASPKRSTANSTRMDCTTLHCTNWTTFICKEHNCTNYDSEIHEPSCSESYCKNIGVKVEYELYCNASIITRVIVKFHVRTVSMALQYINQEVTVNFYMGNNSIDNVVKLSGSPGYIRGLPIIASISESNHTDNFYNSTFGTRNNLLVPSNIDGSCVLTNLIHNVINFGCNKRTKCRVSFIFNSTIHNGTEACQNIQKEIDELFGLERDIFIAPYGNPHGINDNKWMHLRNFNKSNIYGDHHSKDSKLLCYNLVTGISFTIVFAETNDAEGEEYVILSAKVESTIKNVTFSVEDLSTVVTIDTIFVDATVQTVQEYTEAPHLSFHLPKDFFFPLSSKCPSIKFHVTLLYVNLLLYLCK